MMYLNYFSIDDASFQNMDNQKNLLNLAISASQQNNSGAAIAYLRDAISQPDATATAHYLLGAEYAQAQMYDRAISQMEVAISLDPTLSIASLQLGLLHLTSGNGEKAEEAFSSLLQLAEDNSLHQFSLGLTHLIHDRFEECRQCLSQGLNLNGDNAALNADMRKMLEEVEKLSAQIPDENDPEQDAGQHVLLSIYANKNEH